MKTTIIVIGLIALFTSCIKHNITVIQTNQNGDTLINKTFNGSVSCNYNCYGIHDDDKNTYQVIGGGMVSIKYND